jgi:hypothetical protein
MSIYPILNIETFILVAIWEKPFVFQGSFNITNKQDNSKRILFFRCECYLEDQMSLHEEFSPDDYQFTHLYTSQSPVLMERVDSEKEQALYILKYAFKATLEQMITRTTPYFTYIDEIAMSRMSEQIEQYIKCDKQKNIDDDHIGFAVSIDFTPHENTGKMAAATLWKLISC